MNSLTTAHKICRKRICRLCTKNYPNKLQSFFSIFNDVTLDLMLLSICSSLQVSVEDGLPQGVCPTCITSLVQAYYFQEQCLHSHMKLLQLFALKTDICYENQNTKLMPNEDDEDDIPLAFLNIATCNLNEINAEFKCEIEDDFEDRGDSSMLKENILDEESVSQNEINPLHEKPIQTISATKKLNDKYETTTSTKETKKVSGNESKTYSCPICGICFVETSQIKRHMAVHSRTKSKSRVCTICDKSFPRERSYARHMIIHNPEGRPFECKVCKQRFAFENNLKRHKIVHSGILETSVTKSNAEKIFECLKCGRVFEKQVSLSLHIRSHKAEKDSSNPNELSCKYCDKVFTKMTELTRHSRMHEETKVHQCGICEKRFALASQFNDHMNLHSGLKPHVCTVCNKAFQQKLTLQNHLRIHSGKTPILCYECGKSFHSESNLKAHLLRHTGERPFKCDECPSRFYCRGGLTSHMVSHTGIKRFTCDVCNKSFTANSTLTKHKRTHTGYRPFACDICSMRFNTSDLLKRHNLVHTGEKPYKCTMCVRAFGQSNDLVKHLKSHLGDKIYQCKYCTSAFGMNGELMTHTKIHYDKVKGVYCNEVFDVTEKTTNKENPGMPVDVDEKLEKVVEFNDFF